MLKHEIKVASWNTTSGPVSVPLLWEICILKLLQLSLAFKLKKLNMNKASIVKELSEDMWCLVILEFIQVSFNSYVNKRQKSFIFFHFADSTIFLILVIFINLL